MNYKNKVTNILGIIFWVIAIKIAISKDPQITFFLILVVIGGALFLFKNELLKRIIHNVIKLFVAKITKK